MILFLDDLAWQDRLSELIDRQGLLVDIDYIYIEKINNKQLNLALDRLTEAQRSKPWLCVDKDKLVLLCRDAGSLLKATPDWQSHTRRIVNAGRKSEILLQACKPTDGMRVIDGTAGFGQDSLILASTGAQVLMVEKSPALSLLLLAEQQRMLANQNWHKLLARLTLVCADFCQLQTSADLVYLDPMFPKDSYQAKVNKNMQALQNLALPPTADQEKTMLDQALTLAPKVVVKRPVQAPFLASQEPVQSWQNDLIRLDKYEA